MRFALKLFIPAVVLSLASCGSLKVSIKDATQKKKRSEREVETAVTGLSSPNRVEANPQIVRPPKGIPAGSQLAPFPEAEPASGDGREVSPAERLPSSSSSPASSSWLPDGRCYFCSGRGQKFDGSDFISCPHCDGKGRR